jgi:hypothetical protein
MPTEWSRDLFGFAPVEGRRVAAAFDGGDASSDAGALLLGATDRAIGLVGRFAARFADGREAGRVEHTVATVVAQRVFGIALGGACPRAGEAGPVGGPDRPRPSIGAPTPIDRHDPVLATLMGELQAKRQDCAPLAGKSCLKQGYRPLGDMSPSTGSSTRRRRRAGTTRSATTGRRSPAGRAVPRSAQATAARDHP